MDHLKNLILDMDGVLWHGDTPMPGLADFFTTLRQRQINFILATNNASQTPEQYVAKLAKFGVSITSEQVLTSAMVTANYLSDEGKTAVAVFVIGGDGIHQALQAHGFTILTVADVMEHGRRAEIVVVSIWRQATYADFAAATVCLNGGARFIGTNADATLPSEWGPLPGAGSFLALLIAATGIQPTVIGKPGIIMFQEALKRLGGTPQNTAMVGDRLSTDIAGGKAAGLQTILLLSGISTHAELALPNAVQPDYVFTDISELAKRLEIGD